jgi:uncharacterized membrane protein YfcA
LVFAAFGTAVLSGVFGMAGGLVLRGVYALLLPVALAQVLHGATQLTANGARAAILWRSIHFRSVGHYLAGALPAFALLTGVQLVPDRLLVFLGLGLVPFVARLVPARLLDFERPLSAALCGASVMTTNLLAGAAGPLLDVAFVDTQLTKTEVVATKAFTQVLSHSLKLVFFAPLLGGAVLSPWLLAALTIATLLGTYAGTVLLNRLSEQGFRNASRRLVLAIGALYLVRAMVEL